MAIDLETLRKTVGDDASARAEDAERAGARWFAALLNGRTWRALLTTLLVLAALMLAGAAAWFLAHRPLHSPSFGGAEIRRFVATLRPAPRQAANPASVAPAPRARPDHAGAAARPPLSIEAVARDADPDIARVLALARTGDQAAIAEAARQAGRSIDFSRYRWQRDRKAARALNQDAIAAFNGRGDAQAAYEIQRKALEADPLDGEVAGNLALYAYRTGRVGEARLYALYALAVPRADGKSGRTADWTTLAAIEAANGDAAGARGAMYVTLALASDVRLRCVSAVQATARTYGSRLRDATEAMLARVRERSLSDAPECGLPVRW
ncbi:hypothetical protein [Burkholderia plantarii]|uniref:hypothetical protein n=1 Tax=Burkholderia plantarii TaxID=41899 RepID=UPI0006D89086|nr:hypothetical protein [Burkholderia plantarii]ALK33044.1 hypothetical protein bpln_2g07930 [Burkholderia plantarii]GLZ20477.1 hypothetical protein Bpla01_40060 [Burkholderia plantarii]